MLANIPVITMSQKGAIMRKAFANIPSPPIATMLSLIAALAIGVGIGEQLKNPALRKWVLGRLGGN